MPENDSETHEYDDAPVYLPKGRWQEAGLERTVDQRSRSRSRQVQAHGKCSAETIAGERAVKGTCEWVESRIEA
jgi:hypothetical protein